MIQSRMPLTRPGTFGGIVFSLAVFRTGHDGAWPSRELSLKMNRECSVPLFSATLGWPTSRGKRSADSVCPELCRRIARSNAKGRDGSASDCRGCKEEGAALYFSYAPTRDDEADAAISRAIRHAEDALPVAETVATPPYLWHYPTESFRLRSSVHLARTLQTVF
jgi:hypothetical protein